MGLIYSDIPELEGSNTEITLANLSELERELEMILEQRIAHLGELSEAILTDGGDIDIIKSIILSIKSEGKADSGEIISENRHIADVVFSKLSLIERLTVFKEVFANLSDEGKQALKNLWQSPIERLTAYSAERIAYIKNSYNDTAYMQFSSLFKSPKVSYFTSVNDVCDSVYKGDCEYCILPIETSSDGKLLSFYELIFKYNFKIVSVYDLHSNNGYTRYALLSKRLWAQGSAMKTKTRNRYFEFAISSRDNVKIEDVLCAAEFCSLKLRRIDTLSMHRGENDNETYFCPICRVDGADLQTFLSFLAIDCPDFIPIGLYTQI